MLAFTTYRECVVVPSLHTCAGGGPEGGCGVMGTLTGLAFTGNEGDVGVHAGGGIEGGVGPRVAGVAIITFVGVSGGPRLHRRPDEIFAG